MSLPLFPEVDPNRVLLYSLFMSKEPFLFHAHVHVVREYNPEYGDDRMCQCGHPYYRHFDTYEDMLDIGCKYMMDCGCPGFEEGGPFSPIPRNYFDGSDRI